MRRIPGLFRHKNYLSMLVYGLAALAVLLMQTAPHLFLSLWGARPVPIVLLVVCVALCEGAQAGAIIGALSGLLWGIYSFRLFGFDALVLMLIGLTAGLLVEWLLRANLLTALLLCTGASLAQALLEWLFCYVLFFKEQVLVVLCRVYLPNCLYTAVLTPLMYWLVLGLARLIRRRSRAGV